MLCDCSPIRTTYWCFVFHILNAAQYPAVKTLQCPLRVFSSSVNVRGHSCNFCPPQIALFCRTRTNRATRRLRIVYDLLNGTITNDLEWPLTRSQPLFVRVTGLLGTRAYCAYVILCHCRVVRWHFSGVVDKCIITLCHISSGFYVLKLLKSHFWLRYSRNNRWCFWTTVYFSYF